MDFADQSGGSISPYLAPYPSTAGDAATDDAESELAHADIECCTIVPRCMRPMAEGAFDVGADPVAEAVGAVVDLPARKRPFRVTVQCKEGRPAESALHPTLLALPFRRVPAGTLSRKLEQQVPHEQ